MITPTKSNSLKLNATFTLGGAPSCVLAIRVAPDGYEQTIISYDSKSGMLNEDTTPFRPPGGTIESVPFVLTNVERLCRTVSSTGQ